MSTKDTAAWLPNDEANATATVTRSGRSWRWRAVAAATGLAGLALVVSGCGGAALPSTAGAAPTGAAAADSTQAAPSDPADSAAPTAAAPSENQATATPTNSPATSSGSCSLPGLESGIDAVCADTGTASALTTRQLFRSADTIDGQHVHVYPGTLGDDGSVVVQLAATDDAPVSFGLMSASGFAPIPAEVAPYAMDQVARSGKNIAWMTYTDTTWQVYVYDGSTVRELASSETVSGVAGLRVLPAAQDLEIVGDEVLWHLGTMTGSAKEPHWRTLVSVPLTGGRAQLTPDSAMGSARTADGTVYAVVAADGGWQVTATPAGGTARPIYSAQGEGPASGISLHAEGGVVTWAGYPHLSGDASDWSDSVVYSYQPEAHRLTRITTTASLNAFDDLSVGSGTLVFGDKDHGTLYAVDVATGAVRSQDGNSRMAEPGAMISPDGRTVWRALPAIAGSSVGIQADAQAFAVEAIG